MQATPTLAQPNGHLAVDAPLSRIGEYLGINFDILDGKKPHASTFEQMMYGSDISQMISDVEECLGLCSWLDPNGMAACEVDVMLANVKYARNHFQVDAPGMDTLIALTQIYRVYQLAQEGMHQSESQKLACFTNALLAYANEQRINPPLRKDFNFSARV